MNVRTADFNTLIDMQDMVEHEIKLRIHSALARLGFDTPHSITYRVVGQSIDVFFFVDRFRQAATLKTSELDDLDTE